jgi:hypothetical protein
LLTVAANTIQKDELTMAKITDPDVQTTMSKLLELLGVPPTAGGELELDIRDREVVDIKVTLDGDDRHQIK